MEVSINKDRMSTIFMLLGIAAVLLGIFLMGISFNYEFELTISNASKYAAKSISTNK